MIKGCPFGDGASDAIPTWSLSPGSFQKMISPGLMFSEVCSFVFEEMDSAWLLK